MAERPPALAYWEIVDDERRSLQRKAGEQRAAFMSLTAPVLALAALVAFSLIARELNYLLTSTSLLVIAGTLLAWFTGLYWMFG